MDLDVLIVGGVGYLGYNLTLEHSLSGDTVRIAARASSVDRRHALAEELKRHARLVILDSLDSRESTGKVLKRHRCPDIVYLATGKSSGGWDSYYEAHVKIPGIWAEEVAEACPDAMVVYISSTLAVGDPRACADNGVVHEEERHLEGCRSVGNYSRSKMMGEAKVMDVCTNTDLRALILRPGLLLGAWCYHDIWKALYKAAKRHLRLSGGPHLSITPARDVARAAMLALSRGSRCLWAYATPWNPTLGDLHRAIARELGAGFSVPIPVPKWVWRRLGARFSRGAEDIVRESVAQMGFVFEPRALNSLGMEWIGLEEAAREAAEWMKMHWG